MERLGPNDVNITQDAPVDVKGCPDWIPEMAEAYARENAARSDEDVISQAPIPVDFE